MTQDGVRGVIAALAVLCGASDAAAAPRPAAWPCGDPPPPVADGSRLWAGARYDASWRNDPAVAALIDQVAPRSVASETAAGRIADFAAGRADRTTAMARVASGLIDEIGHEQRLVIDGIGRFNERQAQIAQRMQAAYAQLDKLPDNAPPPAPDSPEAATREQLRWDTEIFEDRRSLLPVMCKIPGALATRLDTLLAASERAAGAGRR